MSLQRFAVILLAACSALTAQDTKEMILAAGRSGVVELIDPATLATVSRIHFDLPAGSAGFNGISASVDGSELFLEGPNPIDPHNCCYLYSLNLATLRAQLQPRNVFIFSDGVAYPGPNNIARDMGNDRMHLSLDGHRLFGVRSFQGPALDVIDPMRGKLISQLRPAGLEGNWWPSGTWSGDRFYLYAIGPDGSGKLWTVSAATPQLDAGTPIAPFGKVTGCRDPASTTIIASGGNLFLYEMFGFTSDRRPMCASPFPGGAWKVEPTTGRLIGQIAPNLHFAEIVAGRTDSKLYGLSTEGLNWSLAPQLVSVDPADGRILQSRELDPGFWRIAIATLRVIPQGDVLAQGMAGTSQTSH
jgi:hypothetical protein